MSGHNVTFLVTGCDAGGHFWMGSDGFRVGTGLAWYVVRSSGPLVEELVMQAFDYTTQQWVEGEAGRAVALQQARATLALLQSPAGVDYARFINRDHGVAIVEARRAVLELETGRA